MSIKNGLRWAGIEHRWERYTNWVLLFGIAITGYTFTQKMPIAGLFGFIFLFVAGFTHFIARFSHWREKSNMKDVRPWK